MPLQGACLLRAFENHWKKNKEVIFLFCWWCRFFPKKQRSARLNYITVVKQFIFKLLPLTCILHIQYCYNLYYSKWGTLTWSVSTSRKLARNAESQAPFWSYWIRTCILTRSKGGSYAFWLWRALVHIAPKYFPLPAPLVWSKHPSYVYNNSQGPYHSLMTLCSNCLLQGLPFLLGYNLFKIKLVPSISTTMIVGKLTVPSTENIFIKCLEIP